MMPEQPPLPPTKVIAIDPATGDDHTAYAIVEHKEGLLRVLQTGDLMDGRDMFACDSTGTARGNCWPIDVRSATAPCLPEPWQYDCSDAPNPMDTAKRKRLRAERKRRNAIAKASRRRNRRNR